MAAVQKRAPATPDKDLPFIIMSLKPHFTCLDDVRSIILTGISTAEEGSINEIGILARTSEGLR